MTTKAGTGIAGFINGQYDKAQFDHPEGIVVDKNGALFIADTGNHCIRSKSWKCFLNLISRNFFSWLEIGWRVSTLAGTSPGYRDGTIAKFTAPVSIAMDDEGNLLVCDEGNHKIRKVTQNGKIFWHPLLHYEFDVSLGVVSTIVGDSQGSVDGKHSEASFSHPRGIACEWTGNIIVAENSGHRIRKIT